MSGPAARWPNDEKEARVFMPGEIAEVVDHDRDGDTFRVRFYGSAAGAKALGYATWKNRLAEANRKEPRGHPGPRRRVA